MRPDGPTRLIPRLAPILVLLGLPNSSLPQAPANFDEQLLLARSADGVQFAGREVISEHARSPSWAQHPDGRLYLYYWARVPGDRRGGVSAAISADGGKTWLFKDVSLSSPAEISAPRKPYVRVLPDGTFRLYFTASRSPVSLPGIYSARSSDGIQFDYEGAAFVDERITLDDALVVQIGNQWHIYAVDLGNRVWHGVSPDGRRFVRDEGENFSALNLTLRRMVPEALCTPSDAMPRPDGKTHLMLLCRLPERDSGTIVSVVTSDGRQFEPGGNVRVIDQNDSQKDVLVRGGAVIRLPHKTFLLAYVTSISR